MTFCWKTDHSGSHHSAPEGASGAHRLETYVPYAFPRRAGHATADFTMSGSALSLEYMAPSVVFAKGRISGADRPRSTGFKGVHVFNAAAVLLVVAYLASRAFS